MWLVLLVSSCCVYICDLFFFFQAEDGIRDLVRSRGLGDVYKRQVYWLENNIAVTTNDLGEFNIVTPDELPAKLVVSFCLLYTSDAADERSSVDLGGRRIIKKKNK